MIPSVHMSSSRARYIMVGGFLGAGKTTAVLRLARHLDAGGLRVGLITNDQSVGLVDSALAASQGFDVEEITGGCFCCRFNSLVDAATRLSAATRPDVFIAEPVGSCTDLRATVAYPLRRMYGEAYSIAPLSVLVDPMRALRALDLEPGRSFSKKVLYVYGKQLEEADVIVINKIDAVEPERVARLREALAARFDARVIEMSARSGDGLEAWFDAVAGESAAAADMPIDYTVYGEGEALLGWLNATVGVTGDALDGNAWLEALGREIAARLSAQQIEIAHFKMTLSPHGEGGDIAVLNQVGSDRAAEQAHRLAAPIDEGTLILNLRAEGDPSALREAVLEGLIATADKARTAIEHMEHFRPSQPSPTHRMASV
jgi:Ni2+-binding GTPase involved in maturation of urease and hydrogenase